MIHAARVARGAFLVAREYMSLLRAPTLRTSKASSSHPPILHRGGALSSEPRDVRWEPVETVSTLDALESDAMLRDDNNAAPLESASEASYATAHEEEAASARVDLAPGREVAVPESRIARVAGFGSLAAGLLMGAAAESARRALGSTSTSTSQSAFMSEANAQRLASSLSRMRGAALKVGQMLSIQDERVIPPAILRALDRVRQRADVMPRSQLERVLRDAYGSEDWRDQIGVTEFDMQPIAAASIGQVHRGRIADENGKQVDVVFKVQYPGVARSIASDLSNLKRLISVANFVPDNFYIDEAIVAAREELTRECDYQLEAANQAQYRSILLQSSLADEFYVPTVYTHASTPTVLVSEYVRGVPIDTVSDTASKNRIARMLLKLTLAELFEFRFQQSDPNFANFFWDPQTQQMNLIDFGAAREYSSQFLRDYLRLIEACARRDPDAVLSHSRTLGFLTGEESSIMNDAHIEASFLVGEPFHVDHIGGYDFSTSDIPRRTAEAGKIMLKYRLTPPPKEAYSLHRRLSGAFLTCTRLGATVDAATMLNQTLERVKARERQE